MEAVEILLVGLAPLVQQVTDALKGVPYLNKVAPLISLVVGYVIVFAITRDTTTTLLVGSALGGGASLLYKGDKMRKALSGEPEIGHAPLD